MGPQSWRLDENRWRFQHGPIDLVLAFWGAAGQREAAAAQAWDAFAGILPDLAAELPRLRKPTGPMPASPVARAMVRAVAPHRRQFITPMAAVAGAVSDFILAAAVKDAALARAFVNNGGDIALHLTPSQGFDAGIAGDISEPAVSAGFSLSHDLPVRGIASSGWRGRSHSLGIADTVTVLAANAAQADAAATLLANAVDVDDDAVTRAPARALDPDSDLGERLVTLDVAPLAAAPRRLALERGEAAARAMLAKGLLHGALILLQNYHAAVGICRRRLAAT